MSSTIFGGDGFREGSSVGDGGSREDLSVRH